MSQPTKAQWDEIAQRLDRQFDAVYLRCDGYLVSASLTRIKNRLEIVIYVNGYIKGEWYGLYEKVEEMSEEAKRFYMPHRRQKWKAKEMKFNEGVWGKRECRKRGYYDPWISPAPTWRSAKSFIRHLKKHNEQIEILTREEHHAALEALKSEAATNA